MARSALDEMSDSGTFTRTASTFRNFISGDPNSQFPPESRRYHLYVSYACPWASRRTGCCTPAPDPFNGVKSIRELYELASTNYTGKFTVPVLWDKKFKTIVSNESAEIIRMLNTEFNEIAENPALDFLKQESDSSHGSSIADTNDDGDKKLDGNCNGLSKSVKVRLYALGSEVLLQSCSSSLSGVVKKKQRCQRRRKLGEEEQAAISLITMELCWTVSVPTNKG
ncbi:hypothetical protein V6N13_120030 [Hibiscus sabdariffa]